MNERWFKPVEAGPGVRVPQRCGGTLKSSVRRQAGPPMTPHQDIENTFDIADSSSKGLHRQAYPVCWLKRHYGLSRNYAAIVAAEFRWEGA